MEKNGNSHSWVWIVVALVVGLLLSCGVSAVVGGVAGYLAGQRAAIGVSMFQERDLDVAPFGRALPREAPVPEVPLPRVPEGLPFEQDSSGAALIVQVIEDGPAAAADLRVGDIVIEIDGEPLRGEDALADMIMEHEPGDMVDLTIMRRGRTRTVSVELGRHPDADG